jgi:hypothetical protein
MIIVRHIPAVLISRLGNLRRRELWKCILMRELLSRELLMTRGYDNDWSLVNCN